jgi:hypothetical protein
MLESLSPHKPPISDTTNTVMLEGTFTALTKSKRWIASKTPENEPETDPYISACALWATVKGEKVQFGNATKAALEYVATNSKEPERVEAAMLILERKFGLVRPNSEGG